MTDERPRYDPNELTIEDSETGEEVFSGNVTDFSLSFDRNEESPHVLDDAHIDRISLAEPGEEYELSGFFAPEPPELGLVDLEIRKEVPNAFGLADTTVGEHIREEVEYVERAIRGAIRAGFDGVDINRPPMGAGLDALGIENVTPWHRPAPEGANGYRTERYSWDWFSDDELSRLLTDGEYCRSLAGELGGHTDE